MDLRERLILEQQILQRDGLTQFQIYSNAASGGYYVWGECHTNSGNAYTLWSPIPLHYPYDCPPLYIWKPNPLRGYGGKSINSYGLSHQMHTLNSGPSGEVQICHWRSERWHSGITLNKVLIKALIWLEAYEQHLTTGKPINEFVRTMQ